MIVKRPIAFLLFLTCGFVAASANDSPTKAEFEALVARVEKLESILASLENSARIEAKQGSVSPASLNSGESKDTLLDNFIRVIHNREDNINYPWMDLELWNSLKPGISEDEVLEILGEPNLIEPSLHKRIDTVYTYKGKQTSTGIKVTGIVRFYRDKLMEVELPKI